MRYALFSDIHANIEAFSAVLADIDSVGVDQKLFLGDIVGYGPDPEECIDRLLDVADLSLGGNHDWAAVGMTPADYFNPYAKDALDYSIENIRDDQIEFLTRTKASMLYNSFQIAHSTPSNPEEWRYILSHHEARENFDAIENNLCFIGHSHQPLVIEYSLTGEAKVYKPQDMVLDPDLPYIVNIGSVGQPRDSDVNSCWVLFDSERRFISFRRVPYEVSIVQEKMRKAGLPEYLVDRLAIGR